MIQTMAQDNKWFVALVTIKLTERKELRRNRTPIPYFYADPVKAF